MSARMRGRQKNGVAPVVAGGAVPVIPLIRGPETEMPAENVQRLDPGRRIAVNTGGNGTGKVEIMIDGGGDEGRAAVTTTLRPGDIQNRQAVEIGIGEVANGKPYRKTSPVGRLRFAMWSTGT